MELYLECMAHPDTSSKLAGRHEVRVGRID